MKTVNSHSTQTKKTYRKPALKSFGNVKKLTKGKLGGSVDLDGVTFNFDSNS